MPPQAFLKRTTELVDLMLPAMDGMPTGLIYLLCDSQCAPVTAALNPNFCKQAPARSLPAM